PGAGRAGGAGTGGRDGDLVAPLSPGAPGGLVAGFPRECHPPHQIGGREPAAEPDPDACRHPMSPVAPVWYALQPERDIPVLPTPSISGRSRPPRPDRARS